MIRIAVVGTGSIGVSHLEAIQKAGVCELCAVCDADEGKVSPLAERYNVPYFTDYRKIPEKAAADAVILNLPHFLHGESAVFFLEHGIHVLVEKPMANSVEECDRMIAARDRSGCRLAVGHTQRYFNVNKYVKKAIESGEYGKLAMVNGIRSINYFLDSRPRWFLDKQKAGGGIGVNYGAHALDTMFYVTGEQMPEIVSSFGNLKNDYPIEGHVQFMLRFPDGVSMCETLSGYNLSGHETTYYFTDGVLKVVDGFDLFQITNGGWERIEIPEKEDKLERQLRDFVRYIDGNPGMICTAEEGRKVIAVLEEIYGQQDMETSGAKARD